jgi:acetyltransferase-like isoleucine patch superfamily enzyme
MVPRPLRPLALPEATRALHDHWLGAIAERLAEPAGDRNRLCREILMELYYPGLGHWDDLVADRAVPAGTRAALLALDPRNVTLEPEYYHEIDPVRYARVKPLLWLWQSFDRSPMGGGNVAVAVRFRRLLAEHVFAHCGANFKCFQFVEFSFGYNLSVGDNVVIHRHVLLDDRAPITIGDRASVADYANVYTHSHSLVDQVDVTSVPVTLGPGARVTYHATVLAGASIGEQGMLGAMAVATRPVKPWHLYLGIPAVSKTVKPDAPPAIRDQG